MVDREVLATCVYIRFDTAGGPFGGWPRWVLVRPWVSRCDLVLTRWVASCTQLPEIVRVVGLSGSAFFPTFSCVARSCKMNTVGTRQHVAPSRLLALSAAQNRTRRQLYWKICV